MTDALEFAFRQMIKRLWISMPGIIISYNENTKRCKVQPAVNIRKTDGSTVVPTPIVNVPVEWPSGGGFSILAPLPAGEPVVINFSQRGITQFKELFSQSDPGKGIFAKEDAVVRAGFGSLEVTPATSDGISMQSDNGENYLYVENGIVKIEAATKISMVAPDIDFSGNLNMLDGIITGPDVFGGSDSDKHTHAQANDSGGNTEQPTGSPQ